MGVDPEIASEYHPQIRKRGGRAVAIVFGMLLGFGLPLAVLVWSAWVSSPSWASERVRIVRVEMPEPPTRGSWKVKGWKTIIQVELIDRPKRERATIEDEFFSEQARRIFIDAINSRPSVRFWEGTPPEAAFHAGPSDIRFGIWLWFLASILVVIGVFISGSLRDAEDRYPTRRAAIVSNSAVAAPLGMIGALVTWFVYNGLAEYQLMSSPFQQINGTVYVLAACAAGMLLFALGGSAIAWYKTRDIDAGEEGYAPEDTSPTFSFARVRRGLNVLFVALVVGCFALSAWEATGTIVSGRVAAAGAAEADLGGRGRNSLPIGDVYIVTLNFIASGSSDRTPIPIERWFFTKRAADHFAKTSAGVTSIRVRSWPWQSAVTTITIPAGRMWLMLVCGTFILAVRAFARGAATDSDDDPMPMAKSWFWFGGAFFMGTLPGGTWLICALFGLHELHAGPWGWVPILLAWPIVVGFWGLLAVLVTLFRLGMRSTSKWVR